MVEKWLHEYLGRKPIEDDYSSPSIATPDQIAQVIASLASKEMSWVNGAVIPVDGGFSLG
jgi:NAD(P)-dependent dehydrogenase (short-subunit alcohol dehydrogenase family)